MEKYLVLLVLFCFQISMVRDRVLDLDINKFKVASKTDQIILVIPETITSHQAKFYYYIKNPLTNQWDEERAIDCNIGKAGIGKQVEGDMKTPTGVFQFDLYFGIEPNPSNTLPYIKLNYSHFWDCDSKSEMYNRLVNIETYRDFDISVSENLTNVTPGYEYAANIDFNKECISGLGSGVFLHCKTTRDYTAGCVAIDKNDLEEIYRKLSKNCYIIIDLLKNMDRYYSKAEFGKVGILFILFNLLLLLF